MVSLYVFYLNNLCGISTLVRTLGLWIVNLLYMYILFLCCSFVAPTLFLLLLLLFVVVEWNTEAAYLT